jgi:hypothetical protein
MQSGMTTNRDPETERFVTSTAEELVKVMSKFTADYVALTAQYSAAMASLSASAHAEIEVLMKKEPVLDRSN